MQVDLPQLSDAIRSAVREAHALLRKKAPPRAAAGGTPELNALRPMLQPLVEDLVTQVDVEDIRRVVVAAGALPEKACLAGVGKPGARLGAGAFGHVFPLDARRAVKLTRLRKHRWMRVRLTPKQAFEHEVGMMRRAAAAGVGPKVLDSYACCDELGPCFGVIVMERVPGKTLTEWRDANKNKKRAEAVRARLLAAIEKLHAAGVFHNDLHSSNVMVTPRGDVRIVDYGLATPDARQLFPMPGEGPGFRHHDFRIVDRWGDAPGHFRSTTTHSELFDLVLARLLETGAVRVTR